MVAADVSVRECSQYFRWASSAVRRMHHSFVLPLEQGSTLLYRVRSGPGRFASGLWSTKPPIVERLYHGLLCALPQSIVRLQTLYAHDPVALGATGVLVREEKKNKKKLSGGVTTV